MTDEELKQQFAEYDRNRAIIEACHVKWEKQFRMLSALLLGTIAWCVTGGAYFSWVHAKIIGVAGAAYFIAGSLSIFGLGIVCGWVGRGIKDDVRVFKGGKNGLS